MNKEIAYVTPDKTSVEEKVKKTLNLGYHKKYRWQDNQRILVISGDYDKYITMSKNLLYEQTEKDDNLNKIIHTEFFKYKKNNALYTTISVVPKEIPQDNLTQNAVFNQKNFECFTASNILLNLYTRKCKRNGYTTEILDYMQLYRYEPFGEHFHLNNFSFINKDVLKIYRNYFPEEVGFPHFHFMSAVESIKLGETAKSNAIDLKNLIKYVIDLIKDDDEKSVLNTNSFGMPFLAFKKSSYLYKSTLNDDNIAQSHNVDTVLKSINNSLDTTSTAIQEKEGLDAVLSDLLALEKLHNCKDYSKNKLLVELKLVNKICGRCAGKPIVLEGPKHEK